MKILENVIRFSIHTPPKQIMKILENVIRFSIHTPPKAHPPKQMTMLV